jgi:metal-dependent amidase/aminoacylase/carboxypeptidase family protein
LSGSGLLQQVACTLTPMRPFSLESPRCWYVIAIASRGVLPSTGDIARVAALVVTALYDLVEKGITKLWHRPGFDIDEDVLPVGVEILALAALDLLQ